MDIVQVQGLKKSFKKGFIPKKVAVLKGLDFSLAEGSITGFLGANGAGKTTTLKCLLGLTFPDSGKMSIFGEPSVTTQVKERIGFLPERPYFYEYLTGNEFLHFYASLSCSEPTRVIKERITELLKKVDLLHARDKKIREYSKGMLQKIGLAQALVHNPDLVILDEPMSGLDPDGRFYVAELIREVVKSGKTVFFSSHLLNDVERLCENLVIIKHGKVEYSGKLSTLLDSVKAETEIIGVRQGERIHERLPADRPLEPRLSELISTGTTIVEVRSLQRSLEEAFVDVALRRPENESD